MKKSSLLAVCLFFGILASSLSLPLHCIEMVVWHRTIGAEATANGVFISKMYSPNSGYTQFSLPPGEEDNNNFLIQNTDELACAGPLSQGAYTIVIHVSNGSAIKVHTVQIDIVAGNVHPQITSSDRYVLVLTNSGALYSFGNGNFGALGSGNTSNQSTPYHVNHSESVLVSQDLCSVSTGSYYSSYCLTRSGTVFAFGSNSFGQLGLGSTTDMLIPTEVTALSSEVIVKVVAGHQHTCFLTSEGKLWSVGKNSDGQLGNGTNTDSSTVISLHQSGSVLENVFLIDVLCGERSIVALTSTGLYCWGFGAMGNLGLGNQLSYNVPQVLSVGFTAEFISGVGHSLFAGDDTGSLHATGYNYFGELGLGDTTFRTTFTNMTTSLSGNVVGVSSRNNSTLMLTSTGAVYGCGRNHNNQLAPGSTDNRIVPTLISSSEFGGDTATQVATGGYSSYVLTSAGNLYGIGSQPGSTSFTTISLAVGSNALIAMNNAPDNAATTDMPISTFSIGWTSYDAVLPDWL